MAKVTIRGRSYEVEVHGMTVTVDGQEFPIQLQPGPEYTTVTAGGVQYRVELPPEAERASGMEVYVDHRPYTVTWEGNPGGGAARTQRRESPAASTASAGPSSVKGGITAQISGRVVKVLVQQDDTVEAGDVLLLLEAMKMENEIKAPTAGTVTEVRVAEGQRVAEGETMVVVSEG